jgi:hypothetical protein
MGVYCNLNGGIGKPLWEVTYGEFQVWYKGLTGTTFLYPAMTGAVRISILLFYHRIFHLADTPTRWVIWILLALTAVYIVVYSILPGFICRPLRAVWMLLERTPEKCKSNEWYYLYTVSLYSVSVGFDVILLLLPIYPVWKLQMPRKRKIGAILLFALGTSSCVAASYKLAMFVQQWGRIGQIDPRCKYQPSPPSVVKLTDLTKGQPTSLVFLCHRNLINTDIPFGFRLKSSRRVR